MSLKEEQLNDKVINEEYKIWKKHSPFLYDICLVKALQWPTLSLDWLKGSVSDQPRDFLTSSLLLGTAVADYDSTNFVYKALVDLPVSNEDDSTKLHNFLDEGQKIAHQGPVICARASPVNNSVIAALGQGDVPLNIYNTSEYPTSLPSEDGAPATPTQQLKYHETAGRYLAWHLHDGNRLASCDSTPSIAFWDWAASDTPESIYHGNTVFNEIQYRNDKILGGIGEDGSLELVDLRDTQSPAFTLAAHEAPGTSLSFNTLDTNLLATGSSDGNVKVWDFRALKEPRSVLHGHSQQVRSVRWSPHQASVLASGADDRRVKLWDLSLANSEQTHEEENEGPPELIFIHGGHVARIDALEWHPTIPWVVASTSEDNVVQIWQPASAIVNATAE